MTWPPQQDPCDCPTCLRADEVSTPTGRTCTETDPCQFCAPPPVRPMREWIADTDPAPAEEPPEPRPPIWRRILGAPRPT